MKCSSQCLKKWMKENLLLLLTLVGVALGFILVAILKSLDVSDDAKMWIGLPGELFMRGLRCMILPVITSSIITATASVDPKSNGKMSGISFVYTFSVVFLGVALGLTLSLTVKPGDSNADIGHSDYEPTYYETLDVIADLLRNMIPANIVQACLESSYTEYTFEKRNVNGTNGTITEDVVATKESAYSNRTNILGLLVFSAVFGFTMSLFKEETRTMFNFMASLRIISLRILSIYIWTLPVGTASLIFSALIDVSDLTAVWASLGKFIAVIVAGLAIHFFITLPMIYFITTRRNPYAFWIRCARPAILASVTKTNVAILPEIMKACEVNNGIHRTIVYFVVPLIISIKADGSALFIVSGAMWLAQIANMTLNAGQIITAGIVTWVMGHSLPAVPSASLVAMVTVCSSVGIPSENIGLLLSVEWLLDALRTSVNCMSHCAGAGIVDGIMGKDIEAKEREFEAMQAHELREPKSIVDHETKNAEVFEANSVDSVD